MNQALTILHLSDIHFREGQDFDRSVVLDPLLERVKKDNARGLRPELAIISGDIAFSGKKEQYTLAHSFLDDLLKACGLTKDRLFLVPGNHDVDRDEYRPTDNPRYDDIKTLNAELENPKYKDQLFAGMKEYFAFVNTHYSHLKSKNSALVPFVSTFASACGRNIGLAGLNSAWMCREKNAKPGIIAIGEYQVKKAFKELSEFKETDLTICTFHHPLSWLWAEDRKIVRTYLNNTVVLTGHLHEPEGVLVHDLEGCVWQFQAGGAYLDKGSEDPWPARYHYITIDWDKSRIKLDFRKFFKNTRSWIIDSETGKDGVRIFPGFAASRKQGKNRPAASTIINKTKDRECFRQYCKCALAEHRHLQTCGFETTFRHLIEIERVFINLQANIGYHELDYTIAGKEKLKHFRERENLKDLDIKSAFGALQHYKIKDMMILGDPGSGKTTLLKYILIMLCEAKSEEKLGISSSLIPFFAPLRMWTRGTVDFFSFMAEACLFKNFGISKDIFADLLKKGSAIILLDGLDEAGDKQKRAALIRQLEGVRKQYPDTRFIITSRFAGYMGTERLKGDILELSILDFTLEQIRAFLYTWFSAVEDALHPGEEQWQEKAGRDAKNLITRIGQSDHLINFVKNPLILQITALVHRDRGTLPERRVELYDECTNVLLEKWDMAKGLKVPVTAKEARMLLQPLALWLHSKDERRSAPMAEISGVIKSPLEEIGKQDMDPRELLLNIRDRSGIFMGYSAEEYGFTHLSFQEYLAAEQVRNKFLAGLLVKQYNNRWWREVILLACALTNPSIFDEFLKQCIRQKTFEEEITLVSDALHDSIIKPIAPLLDALDDKALSGRVKYNVLTLLKEIGGDKVIAAIEKTAQSNDKELAAYAYQVLSQVDKKAAERLKNKAGIAEKIINKKDSSEMVLIPAGPFLYGSKEDDKIAYPDEKPQRVLELEAFYMDVYPVTNEKYCLFLNDAKPGSGELEKWIDFSGSFEDEKCRIKKQQKFYTVENGYENHPVIYVSWHGAMVYAEWAGKRLPREQEWEKAARGTDGRIYPWGNAFDKNLCNTSASDSNGTNPVNRYPGGESPYGCFDMAGNVWEWTASLYSDSKDTYVLRGGSWSFGPVSCRCAFRLVNHPLYRVGNAGFRCVRI